MPVNEITAPARRRGCGTISGRSFRGRQSPAVKAALLRVRWLAGAAIPPKDRTLSECEVELPGRDAIPQFITKSMDRHSVSRASVFSRLRPIVRAPNLRTARRVVQVGAAQCVRPGRDRPAAGRWAAGRLRSNCGRIARQPGSGCRARFARSARSVARVVRVRLAVGWLIGRMRAGAVLGAAVVRVVGPRSRRAVLGGAPAPRPAGGQRCAGNPRGRRSARRAPGWQPARRPRGHRPARRLLAARPPGRQARLARRRAPRPPTRRPVDRRPGPARRRCASAACRLRSSSSTCRCRSNSATRACSAARSSSRRAACRSRTPTTASRPSANAARNTITTPRP